MKKRIIQFAQWLLKKAGATPGHRYLFDGPVGYAWIDPCIRQGDPVTGSPDPSKPETVQTKKKPVPITEDDVVTCETCGCLVMKKEAITKKAEIRFRYEDGYRSARNAMLLAAGIDVAGTEDMTAEYLYWPRCCKRCAPKQKKKKG